MPAGDIAQLPRRRRGGAILRLARRPQEAPIAGAQQRAALGELAKKFSLPTLVQAVGILQTLLRNIRTSSRFTKVYKAMSCSLICMFDEIQK